MGWTFLILVHPVEWWCHGEIHFEDALLADSETWSSHYQHQLEQTCLALAHHLKLETEWWCLGEVRFQGAPLTKSSVWLLSTLSPSESIGVSFGLMVMKKDVANTNYAMHGWSDVSYTYIL